MRTRAAISIVLAFAAACGNSSDGSTLRRSKDVADAAKLIDVGQCEAATDKLKAFVSGQPSASDAYLVLGDAWVCRAFAAKVVNASALADAARAYGSALALVPKEPRALLSAAVVEMLMKRGRESAAHLETLRALEPKHRAAANFLAFVLDSGEDALAVLETAYAGRSGVDAMPKTRPVCYAGDDCGQALLLEPVTLDGRAYPAGTRLDDLEEAPNGYEFTDRLYPARKPGRGFVLTRVQRQTGGAFSEFQQCAAQSVDEGRVVEKQAPPLPPVRPVKLASQRDVALGAKWERIACNLRDMEDELGVVDGLAPGSVKAAGSRTKVEQMNVWGGFRPPEVWLAIEHAPVVFERIVYERRVAPAKAVVRFDIDEATAQMVLRATFLTPAEKRALLVGTRLPGAPLLFTMDRRRLDTRRAVFTLRDGVVTIVVQVRDGADTYVNGEFASTTVPPEQLEAGDGAGE